jgi:hypothetical protein
MLKIIMVPYTRLSKQEEEDKVKLARPNSCRDGLIVGSRKNSQHNNCTMVAYLLR